MGKRLVHDSPHVYWAHFQAQTFVMYLGCFGKIGIVVLCFQFYFRVLHVLITVVEFQGSFKSGFVFIFSRVHTQIRENIMVPVVIVPVDHDGQEMIKTFVVFLMVPVPSCHFSPNIVQIQFKMLLVRFAKVPYQQCMCYL